MGKLVTVEQVRTRINFDSISDVDSVLTDIINNLTPDLEHDIRTSFDQCTRTDTWFVQNSLRPAPHVSLTWLYTAQGFVASVGTAIAGPRRAALTSYPLDILPFTENTAGGDDGVLMVADQVLDGCYVQATYTAGFAQDGNGNYQDVPTWLQEQAVMRAIIKLDSIHPHIRFENGDPISVSRMASLVEEGISQFSRYHPRAVKPLNSVVS